MNSSLLEILHVLFKRKALVVGSFAVILISVAVGTLLQPSPYRASGRLMITGQRSYFRLSPGDTRQPAQEPDTRQITTEIETIKSIAFSDKVIAALPSSLVTPEDALTKGNDSPDKRQSSVQQPSFWAKVTAVLPISLSPVAAKNGQTEGNGASGNGHNGVSQQLASLRSNLEVTPVPNSSLIEVAYTDTDPQWAAAVVNTVLDAYPTYQVNLYHNPSSLSFYDGQKEMLAREITEAEEKLKTFQTQENLFSLAQQKDQGLDLIQKVKERMQATDADMNQGKGKIAEIERQLTSQPERIVTAQEVIDPETRMLHEKLVALEVEKNALLQKYTEKDRRVEDKMQEIETLRERLAADAGKKKVVVGERLGLNEVRQYLVRELVEQKVKLGQSQAKGEKLIRQQEELTAELEALNAKGYELQHLEEALKYKKDLYELYSKKAEEARIATAMDREKLVNVKVVDHAPVPATPVATRVSLALLLAVIAGLGTGVGGALALEYVRPTFHSAPDVERHLELPVLALIPDLRQQA